MKKSQYQQQDTDFNEPLIQKIIVFGVLDSQNLCISQIRRNEIKVGILKSFVYNPQKNQIQDNTSTQQNKYQIWVYPDGIKIYDSHNNILNDPQPQYSFFEHNTIDALKIIDQKNQQNQFLIHDEKQKIKDNIYSFVLTDYQLNRTYCTCLIWNQKKFVENDQQSQQFQQNKQNSNLTNKLLRQNIKRDKKRHNQNSKIVPFPKCTLNDLIKDPLVLDPTTSLVFIPKGLIVCSKYPFLKFQRDMVSFLYINAIKKLQQASIKKQQIKKFKSLVAKLGYPNAQKEYDNQQFTQQLKLLQKRFEKQLPINPAKLRSRNYYYKILLMSLQQRFDPIHFRSFNKNKLQQFYLSFAFLPQLISNTSRIKNKQYQLPPVQIIQIEETNNCLCSFQNLYITSTCFKVPNFDIIKVIQKVGIQSLLILWKNALLQRQILIFSSNLFFSIQLFQTILYLLQPLKWQNIYIPFLPFHLCHHVEALGGYLIGMSKIHMNYMIEHFNLQTKVMVDLDQMIIIQQGGANDIIIPENIKNWMLNHLINLGFNINRLFNQSDKSVYIKKSLWDLKLSRYLRINQQQLFPIKNNQNLIKNQNNNQNAQHIDSQKQKQVKKIFNIHKIFFIGLFYLINNYSSFIYLSQQNRGIKFDRQSYLKIFPSSQQKKFANQIIKTMMFVRVCEFHKNAQKQLKWNQQDICSLFVYCHYLMKNQNKQLDIQKQNLNDIKYWDINLNNQKHGSQKMIQYLNYVVNKNINQMFNSKSIHIKKFKVQHYLIKFISYLNYYKPDKAKSLSIFYQSSESMGWFSYLKQLIRKQNVQIVDNQKQKKDKLNEAHDFWRNDKKIVNLKHLFGDIIKSQSSKLMSGKYSNIQQHINLQKRNNIKSKN